MPRKRLEHRVNNKEHGTEQNSFPQDIQGLVRSELQRGYNSVPHRKSKMAAGKYISPGVAYRRAVRLFQQQPFYQAVQQAGNAQPEECSFFPLLSEATAPKPSGSTLKSNK